jgi:hypothetical protein
MYDFYMSIYFRWIVYIFLLVLQIIAYSQNPKLFTEVKKCFNLNCRVITFIIGIISITLSLFGLIALWYIAPFTNILPDYWYILVIILVYAIIIQITLSAKVEVENNNFSPPPETLINKKYRVLLYIFILILNIIYFIQLYLDGGVNLTKTDNIKYVDHLILGRFGGITTKKYTFFIEWFASIKFLMGILEIQNVNNFDACDYGLPSSWDY